MLLRNVFSDRWDKNKSKWVKYVKTHMQDLNINLLQLLEKSKKEIKNMVQKRDTEKWRADLRSKATLNIYSSFKNNIKGDLTYYNDESSRLLFLCRSNTLKLNWRNRFVNPQNGTICDICREEDETIEHFLLFCPRLTEIRKKCSHYDETDLSHFEFLEAILVFKNFNRIEIDNHKKILKTMWKERYKIRKSIGLE